jgi:hypothetical protein
MGLERIESRSEPGRYYYRNPPPTPLPDYPCLRGDGLYTYEVEGTLSYGATLERLVGGRREEPVYFRAMAILALEPDATTVLINGAPVGHIQEKHDLRFRRQLAALGFTSDVQCRAEVRGSNGVAFRNYGVRLDLTFPLPKPKPTPKPKQKRPAD